MTTDPIAAFATKIDLNAKISPVATSAASDPYATAPTDGKV